MTPTEHRADVSTVRRALAAADPGASAAAMLQRLIEAGLDRLPQPGGGKTLSRWRVLAEVARHDLSLAKLFEGHTDALSILHELGGAEATRQRVWGVWAAESPQGKTWVRTAPSGERTLWGAKCWCSGAASATHGLLTAWVEDVSHPLLMSVEIRQPGVRVDASAWQAVGMAGSASLDVSFDGAVAEPVGTPGEYLGRAGFWQGGAGVAACWFGGAQAVADALFDAVRGSAGDHRGNELRMAACGKVDLELVATAALLREGAAWIDAHPHADAQEVALRTRLAAERCAWVVLDEVGRTLGAAPFCRDAKFARMAADLPVFIRQSHAERDFAALGRCWLSLEGDTWAL